MAVPRTREFTWGSPYSIQSCTHKDWIGVDCVQIELRDPQVKSMCVAHDCAFSVNHVGTKAVLQLFNSTVC